MSDEPTLFDDGGPGKISAEDSHAFVTWLQGLPEGWTSLAPISSEVWGTWLSRSVQLVRSLCYGKD